MTTMTARYEIPEVNMGHLLERLEKLNKKAKKLKTSWITLTVVGQETREVRLNSKKTNVLFNTIEVTGESPKIAGWSFIATLDHTVDDPMGNRAGTVVKTIPGETVPDSFRHDDGTCDHCNVRRRRNQTFVVRNDAGEIKRVGRQCLKDFLGHVDPHQVAQIAEFLSAVEQTVRDHERVEYGHGNYLYTADYLTWVAAHIRTHGWRSGREAFEYGGSSTAQDAMGSLLSPVSRDRHSVKVEDEDRVLADEALQWIRDLRENAEEDTLSDYIHNLTVVCASDVFHGVHSGLIGSLIATYKRAMERELKRQRRLNLAQTSDYVGQPKQRLDLTLLVVSMMERVGHYGVTTIVTFTDGENAFTWFASGTPDLESGETYKVKATVKNHEVFNDVKTTYLTRIKVVEKLSAAA